MRNEKAAKVMAEALATAEAMGDEVFANGRDMAAFYNAFTKLTAEPMGRTRAIALNGRLESIKTLIYNMEAFIKEVENCFKNIEIYSEQEQEELVAWGNSLAPAFAHLFLKEVA